MDRQIGAEVPMRVEDIFFSHTDRRGVIRTSNQTFCEVSGFTLDEVVGAPHKIVRHPEMPKGLFWLMWQQLLAGQMVGAFVRNRSKDGRFYWVFAVVSPTEDGFLSVRIKPTGPVGDKVWSIYGECVAAEQGGASPEESAAMLIKKLQALGYPSYAVFQSMAFAEEFGLRGAAMHDIRQTLPERFRSSAEAILGMGAVTQAMLSDFRAIRTVPINMRILASRLENAGGPISAISVNYGSMLDEMSAWVEEFSVGEACPLAQIRDAILSAQFQMCVSLLQKETCALSRKHQQDGSDQGVTEKDMQMLETQARRLPVVQIAALDEVEVGAGQLTRSVLDMKRYVAGLSSTRMLCKIESAGLEAGGEALSGIVNQLDECQTSIEQQLARICDLNGTIQSNTTLLRASL